MQLVVSLVTRQAPPQPPIHRHHVCALNEVAPLPPEISRSSALLSLCTQSGEAWKAVGMQADGKQREKTKALL